MSEPTVSGDIDREALERSFELLVDVVATVSHDGKRPTAAGVKSAMLARDATFSEKAFGFRQFILYLRAAERRGLVWIALDELGHPRVSDAPIADSGPALVEQARVPATSPTQPAVKVRSDLWFATVPWASNVRRLWDRSTSRALVIPTDQDGVPLWEARPDRFVEIAPIPKADQLEWMREFARMQAPAEQSAILQSLDDSAAPGAFKRALHRLGLEESWTLLLQTRTAEHLRAWAAAHGIPAARLFDKRPRRTSATAEAPSAPTAPLRIVEATPPHSETSPGTADGYEERLRSRMHAVIDRMSVAELAALTVPASYLLAD